MKVFAASVALQLEDERRAVGFVFNLTLEAVERASKHPAGFLDRLKRDLDREVKRAGFDLPYWFCIDVDRDKRLHIHGAFLSHDMELPRLRELFRKAWGEWKGPGKDKQLWLSPLAVDDGWGSYSMRNQKRVAKIIGERTFTISQPLRREAQSAYNEIRRIMRSEQRRIS
ncbi:hypothetical protein [Rhodopseudomonas palustris]|uniref:hypothetical protein n=1 Tax=Rhodopseudomonas palustris TaxID=1076 RepID=UPI0005A0819E|nr:hypothetical protein [Rhodopseudomonas palustris]